MLDLFNEIINNSWYAAIIVFITQILMLYFRTINIFYTTQSKIFGAIWTGNANAIMWLLSMTIGMTSMVKGNWLPILMYLVGGSFGTYLGIIQERKNKTNGNKKILKG